MRQDAGPGVFSLASGAIPVSARTYPAEEAERSDALEESAHLHFIQPVRGIDRYVPQHRDFDVGLAVIALIPVDYFSPDIQRPANADRAPNYGNAEVTLTDPLGLGLPGLRSVICIAGSTCSTGRCD